MSTLTPTTPASQTVQASQTPQPRLPVRLIRRHPLAAFFAWFFTVGQALAFIPVVAAAAGEDVARQPFIVASTLIGLLLPALVITAVTEGPDAVRALLRSAVAWRRSVGWYVLALVAIPLAAFLLTAAFSGLPDLSVADLLAALVVGFLVQLVVTTLPNNLWEEVAWAGFVQERLQRRHGAVVAAGITGVMFALQHVSLVAGSSLAGAVVLLAVLAVLAVPFRFLAGWILNRTGSVFLVGLVHGAGNAAAGGSGFGEGLLPRIYPDNGLAYSAHLIVLALFGLAAVIATRGRLGLPGRTRP